MVSSEAGSDSSQRGIIVAFLCQEVQGTSINQLIQVAYFT